MHVKKIEVGGIPILAYESLTQAARHIMADNGEVLSGSGIAINPEKIITALDNASVYNALMSANIRYADGIGVVKAMQQKTSDPISRVAGCDLWEIMMQRAAQLNVPVFIFGAAEQTNQETVEKLKAGKTPVAGQAHGYYQDYNAVINLIRESEAKFVSVALGSPKQEMFIEQARRELPDCFFMGVGGTYDVFTGKVKRAPVFWQKIGLEWLYRLVSQPTRWRRQLNLLRFIWMYLTRQL